MMFEIATLLPDAVGAMANHDVGIGANGSPYLQSTVFAPLADTWSLLSFDDDPISTLVVLKYAPYCF